MLEPAVLMMVVVSCLRSEGADRYEIELKMPNPEGEEDVVTNGTFAWIVLPGPTPTERLSAFLPGQRFVLSLTPVERG
jgi:hypothetical protein